MPEQPAATGAQGNAPTAVAAAATSPDTPLVNQIDFGFRGTAYGAGSDQARFQRYRDLRDGGTIDHLRIFKDTDAYRYSVQADNVGYRDQRFSLSYMNYGKVKASFEWNQIPLFYSDSTRTLYDQSTPGLLTLNDAIQTGIQNKTLSLSNALTGASAFDLRTRRDVATFALTYSATPNIDFTVNFRNTQKTGAQPWGGSFGISGAIATELPVPIDHRTTELGTSLEYANDRGYAKVGYDGSFFHNNVTTLTWDNPSRITDSATLGPAQGRMALWPNTEMNTVSAAGGINLPARSHATAFLSVASMTNDNPLLPYTINSALVSPALDRPTSDVKATVTSMNYAFTSRPVNDAVVQCPLSPVRVRQSHGAVQHHQQRQLRHGDCRPQRIQRAVQLHPAHVRRRRVVLAGQIRRPARRLHARRGRSHLPHCREHDRGYRARVGGSDRVGLADGARRLRAFEAGRLAGRSTGAARDRRAADAAAVRHLGSQSGSGQRDRPGDAVVAVVVQRLGRDRQAGLPRHELRLAQQQQQRLLGGIRLRAVECRVARRQLRL